LAAERLDGELDVERRANEAYERYRVTARDRSGRRPGGRLAAYRPPELPAQQSALVRLSASGSNAPRRSGATDFRQGDNGPR
jgi:hypothetical protein